MPSKSGPYLAFLNGTIEQYAKRHALPDRTSDETTPACSSCGVINPRYFGTSLHPCRLSKIHARKGRMPTPEDCEKKSIDPERISKDCPKGYFGLSGQERK